MTDRLLTPAEIDALAQQAKSNWCAASHGHAMTHDQLAAIDALVATAKAASAPRDVPGRSVSQYCVHAIHLTAPCAECAARAPAPTEAPGD